MPLLFKWFVGGNIVIYANKFVTIIFSLSEMSKIETKAHPLAFLENLSSCLLEPLFTLDLECQPLKCLSKNLAEENVIFLVTLSFIVFRKKDEWNLTSIKWINTVLREKLWMCCSLSWHASLFPWVCTTALFTYRVKWNGKSLSWNGSFGAGCTGEMFFDKVHVKMQKWWSRSFLGLYDLCWDNWGVNCKGNCCTALAMLYLAS